MDKLNNQFKKSQKELSKISNEISKLEKIVSNGQITNKRDNLKLWFDLKRTSQKLDQQRKLLDAVDPDQVQKIQVEKDAFEQEFQKESNRFNEIIEKLNISLDTIPPAF